jgi:hypothetical protein
MRGASHAEPPVPRRSAGSDEADDIGVGMAEAFENLCDNLEGPESTMWKV